MDNFMVKCVFKIELTSERNSGIRGVTRPTRDACDYCMEVFFFFFLRGRACPALP